MTIVPDPVLKDWPTGGKPLPARLRAQMEALFGADFGTVRIHVGPHPAAIGAAACAWGERIFLTEEAQALDVRSGHRILAHELAHVVQQREGRAANPFGAGVVLLDDPRLEAEADNAQCALRRPVPRASARQAGGEVIQCINYRALRQLHKDYKNEEGTEGHRKVGDPAVESAVAQLKIYISDYNDLKAQMSGRGSRGALASQLQAAANKITEMKRFFELQGFKLNDDGSINWRASLQGKIHYDHELHRQGLTKVIARSGRLFWESTGTEVSTENMVTYFSGTGYAIYVMSAQGNIHMHSHSIGRYHHSSLLGGKNVSAAGEMKTSADGRLLYLSNKTGHYQATTVSLSQVIHQLSKMGIQPDYDVWATGGGNSTQFSGKASAFLSKTEAEYDYELIRLLDYSLHFHSGVVEELGMVWQSHPRPGFYNSTTGRFIDHRMARKRLKEKGLLPGEAYFDHSGRLSKIEPRYDFTPNVMPGPLNNPVVDNGYEVRPAYGKTPAAPAYGKTPVTPVYGKTPAAPPAYGKTPASVKPRYGWHKPIRNLYGKIRGR